MDSSKHLKTCSVCKTEQPVSNFYKRSASKDGLCPKCKACSFLYSKNYVAANKEKISKNQKKYYQENKQKHKKYFHEYYQNNKNKIKKIVRDYYQENREKILSKRQENKERFNKQSNDYYHKNKERCSEKHKIWSKKNRHKRTAAQIERQLQKKKRTPRWLTDHDKVKIVEVYKMAFELSKSTGVKHHVDHIVPLMGESVSGLHVPQNLQVLPYDENIRKKNKYDDWGNSAE